MIATHLYALIPLLVFLVMSLVFNKSGLVHLLTLGYVIALALISVTNQWEIVFFPVCLFSGIISLILFAYSMFRGDWL